MANETGPSTEQHPFVGTPHKTLLALTIPVMISLIAEPLTGLVDTAFISKLGEAPQAALGVATIALSSVLWIFNFIAIGAQTEIARALGANDPRRIQETTGLALSLATLLGVLLAVLSWPLLSTVATLMEANDSVHSDAVSYLEIRLIGIPAILIIGAATGVLRGVQDMRTPMAIAIGVNVLNILLDPLLIFGAGPVPALGIAGAAWASVGAQCLGALWALQTVRRRIGFPPKPVFSGAGKLFLVGRDLFVRTGLLALFLLVATRAATGIGADAGAAHQAIRQVWMFTAFALDAFAHTAQSLIGFFLGAARIDLARRVARVSCLWGLASGLMISAVMFVCTELAADLLVPVSESSRLHFYSGWLIVILMQPANSLSFVTDGIHWGTRDYRWLRNTMIIATSAGIIAITAMEKLDLAWVWGITAGWVGMRAALGVVRIWPGIGDAPLAKPR